MAPPGHVPGPVETAEGRVGAEPLRREVGTAQVADRHPGAGDAQLSRYPARQLHTVAVDDEHLRVRQRSADRHRPGRLVRYLGDRRPDRGLRRPVGVEQPASGALQVPGELGGQRFPAAQDGAAGQRTGGLGEHRPPEGGRALDDADVLAGDQVDDVQAVPLRGDDHASTAHQRQEQLQRGDVEGHRRRPQDRVPLRRTQQVGEREHHVRQAPVADRHALGPAGGSRRVDDVGGLVGARGAPVRHHGQGPVRRPVRRFQVQPPQYRAARRPSGVPAADDDGPRAGVLDQIAQAFRGLVGIQRKVGGPDSPDAEHRGDHRGRAAERQPDDVAGTHAGPPQGPRHLPAARDELAVGQAAALPRQRDRVRSGAGDRHDHLRDGTDPARAGRGVVGAGEDGPVRGRAQRQQPDRPVHVGRGLDQQLLQALQQRLDVLAVVDLGAVGRDERAGTGTADDRQLDVQPALRPQHVEEGRLLTGDPHVGLVPGAVVEQVPEQRCPPVRRPVAEFGEQGLRGSPGVHHAGQEGVAHLAGELPEAERPVDPQPQRQGADPQTDPRVAVLAHGHRYPDDHVGPGAVPEQQEVVPGEQHQVLGEPQLPS